MKLCAWAKAEAVLANDSTHLRKDAWRKSDEQRGKNKTGTD
jgi:hypothetical protein